MSMNLHLNVLMCETQLSLMKYKKSEKKSYEILRLKNQFQGAKDPKCRKVSGHKSMARLPGFDMADYFSLRLLIITLGPLHCSSHQHTFHMPNRPPPSFIKSRSHLHTSEGVILEKLEGQYGCVRDRIWYDLSILEAWIIGLGNRTQVQYMHLIS